MIPPAPARLTSGLVGGTATAGATVRVYLDGAANASCTATADNAVATACRRSACAPCHGTHTSGGGGLRRMAKALGEDRAVALLDANLAQEKEALRDVEKIATRVSNESANQAVTSSS